MIGYDKEGRDARDVVGVYAVLYVSEKGAFKTGAVPEEASNPSSGQIGGGGSKPQCAHSQHRTVSMRQH